MQEIDCLTLEISRLLERKQKAEDLIKNRNEKFDQKMTDLTSFLLQREEDVASQLRLAEDLITKQVRWHLIPLVF